MNPDLPTADGENGVEKHVESWREPPMLDPEVLLTV
jgi:hypothetical protein